MIIKSMGRKAAGTGKRGGGPFSRLVDYMTRADDHESAESVIWHGFYGDAGMPSEAITKEFQRNAERLKERKNGNVLYHEILSFSKGHQLPEPELIRSVADIGQEYLRARAPNQMAFGAVHRDTDHIHLHLMISANEVGKSDRVRLSKKDFSDIQKSVETYTLEHYPELAQTRVYDKTRDPERLKTQAHEQAMKVRTGGQSRKEALKAQLHQLFERARSPEDLQALMREAGMGVYSRGKTQGVVVRETGGQERKHRFATLGLDTHYLATVERLAQSKTNTKHPPIPDEKEDPMNPIEVVAQVMEAHANDKTPKRPGAAKVVAKEFLTGELHPEWHGDGKEKESQEAEKPYTDSVLRGVERTQNPPQKEQTQDRSRQPPEWGGDNER